MYGRSIAALGAGVYIAGIGATGIVLSAVAFDRPSPWVLASAALLLGTLAALAVGRPHRVERLRHRRRAVPLLVLPAAGVVATLGVAVGWTWAGFGLGLVLSIIAFFGWTGLVRGAETIHAQRVLETDSTRLVSLPPTAERTVSRRLRALNAIFGVSTLALGVGSLVWNGGSGYVYLLIALGPLAVALESQRTVTLTDRGLLFESRFGAKLLEWSELGGYYVGGGDDPDLVVLRSSGWHDNLTFEGEAVDETVVAVVDRHLPRSASPAVPAGGLARNGDGNGDVNGESVPPGSSPE